jgi:hypothetical protein
METRNMTKQKVLLALAAMGLLTLGSVAPVLAQGDPPPPAEGGATMEVPPDPDSMMTDPGMDEGAAGDAAVGEAGPGDPAAEAGDTSGEAGDTGDTGAQPPE